MGLTGKKEPKSPALLPSSSSKSSSQSPKTIRGTWPTLLRSPSSAVLRPLGLKRGELVPRCAFSPLFLSTAVASALLATILLSSAFVLAPAASRAAAVPVVRGVNGEPFEQRVAPEDEPPKVRRTLMRGRAVTQEDLDKYGGALSRSGRRDAS